MSILRQITVSIIARSITAAHKYEDSCDRYIYIDIPAKEQTRTIT